MAATLLPNGRWYTTRDALKRAVFDATSVTDKDDRLDEAIASASEFIEEYTDRLFIPWTGTKEFDWQSSGKIRLGCDLLSAAPTITYNNQGSTIASGDYFLYPLNALDRNKPYTWIEILLTTAQLSFNDTRQSDLAIAGKWGYCEITKHTGVLINGAITDEAATSVTTDSTTAVEVGMTILLDTEQMFVENHDGATAMTVVRGVNGTTAATHVDDTIIYAIYPPLQIRQAANALAARAFMRGESAWTDRTREGDLGFSYFKAMPAEVQSILNRFRRMAPII